MNGISVLTLAKRRTLHLKNMLEGLRRSHRQPDELIIIDMDQTPPLLPPSAFPVRRFHLPAGNLPLAEARNHAAAAACFDTLLFLDVDCIPMRGLLGSVLNHLSVQDMICCPEVRYLGRQDARGDWDEEHLRQTALPHPVRVFPNDGLAICDNPGLFWSVAFGVRRQRFQQLDGFDEVFTGYGAEDTDFGFRAHRSNVVLAFLGGAQIGIGAFHQHHVIYDPPLQHFSDILRNAEIFRRRWDVWPMQGWLRDFEKMGLITITGDTLTTLRQPMKHELADAEAHQRNF